VRYVFGVPGEEILDIVDSLADSRVRFISTRHEQGAAFMADAYGGSPAAPGCACRPSAPAPPTW
jgi:acetolactate synthase-1/2/3 large subunit